MLKLSACPRNGIGVASILNIGVDQQVHTLPICKFEGFVEGLVVLTLISVRAIS